MTKLKLSIGRLVIRAGYPAVFLGLILFGLLICLGVWQVGRAYEKSALNEGWRERSQMPARTPAELLAEPDSAQYRHRLLAWEGEFYPEAYLLLNNRLYKGRIGYHVVALIGSSIGVVPVNLGWIQANALDGSSPGLRLPDGIVSVSGRVHIPSERALFVSKQIPPDRLPASVETIYWQGWTETLGELLGKPMFPHLVQIDPQSSHALAAEWQEAKQATAHHIGYALQWFAMAAVFLFVGLSRISNLWGLLRRETEAA